MAVSHDDIDVPMVALVGFVGALVVFVITVLLVAYYHYEVEAQKVQKADTFEWVKGIQSKAEHNLKNDQRVGIDEAMALTLKGYQSKAPGP